MVVDYDLVLPSCTGLAETTLLLAPSPIIVWATVQNSYNSPNSKPAKCQNYFRLRPNILQGKVIWLEYSGSQFNILLTFKSKLSLSPRHGECGHTPLESLVQSVTQDLSICLHRRLP